MPGHVSVPAHARLAVLVLENAGEGNDDLTAVEVARLAEASGALDFLNEEPDLYSDADVEHQADQWPCWGILRRSAERRAVATQVDAAWVISCRVLPVVVASVSMVTAVKPRLLGDCRKPEWRSFMGGGEWTVVNGQWSVDRLPGLPELQLACCETAIDCCRARRMLRHESRFGTSQ